jgi:cell division transport system ATP-binding protein
MIYAEDTPTTGEVYFNGRPVSKIKRKVLPFYRRNIGTVFQDFKLLPNRTVFENVAFALEVQGVPTDNIDDEVPRILEIVGLESKMEMFPPQLSGGEQQKVSLARALIHRPKMIVADEPTGNLDPNSTWDIIQLLLKINDYGTTVILATHDKGVVDGINRRVVTMDKGRVVRDNHESKYII